MTVRLDLTRLLSCCSGGRSQPGKFATQLQLLRQSSGGWLVPGTGSMTSLPSSMGTAPTTTSSTRSSTRRERGPSRQGLTHTFFQIYILDFIFDVMSSCPCLSWWRPAPRGARPPSWWSPSSPRPAGGTMPTGPWRGWRWVSPAARSWIDRRRRRRWAPSPEGEEDASLSCSLIFPPQPPEI